MVAHLFLTRSAKTEPQTVCCRFHRLVAMVRRNLCVHSRRTYWVRVPTAAALAHNCVVASPGSASADFDRCVDRRRAPPRSQGITGFAAVAGGRHSFWAGVAAQSFPPLLVLLRLQKQRLHNVFVGRSSGSDSTLRLGPYCRAAYALRAMVRKPLAAASFCRARRWERPDTVLVEVIFDPSASRASN
jgi:hypothetical protein